LLLIFTSVRRDTRRLGIAAEMSSRSDLFVIGGHGGWDMDVLAHVLFKDQFKLTCEFLKAFIEHRR
jgi:hypothetical protein